MLVPRGCAVADRAMLIYVACVVTWVMVAFRPKLLTSAISASMILL